MFGGGNLLKKRVAGGREVRRTNAGTQVVAFDEPKKGHLTAESLEVKIQVGSNEQGNGAAELGHLEPLNNLPAAQREREDIEGGDHSSGKEIVKKRMWEGKKGASEGLQAWGRFVQAGPEPPRNFEPAGDGGQNCKLGDYTTVVSKDFWTRERKQWKKVGEV